MTVITEWRQKEVIAELSGKLLAGTDDACAFAAEQARGLAPERTGKLRQSIAHTVSVEGNTITGKMGVRKGKGFAYWGRFHEFGTSKMPAHPFLRPAVFNHAAEILRRICGR